MKHSLFAIALFIAFTTQLLNAQTQTPSSENLSDSSKALQFQIGSNFSLYSFQGTVFSYKHHLTRKTALRIGLSISVGGSNNDNSTDNFYAPSDSLLNGSKKSGNADSRRIDLTTQYVWYFNPASKLLLYGGAGPFLTHEYSFEKTENILTIPGNPLSKSLTETKGTWWTPGIAGIIGVEWFASKAISFMAEYGIQATYTWSNSEIKNTSPYSVLNTTASSKGWGLRGTPVKLGLSLYFQ